QARATFSSVVVVRKDQAAILTELASRPAAILGPPMIEEEALDEEAAAALRAGADGESCLPVAITSSRPNDVVLRVRDRAAGLVVLKDCYSPGWQATDNGKPVKIVRVNGFARGVFVPDGGDHEIHFYYRPASFVIGAWTALATAVVLLAGLCAAK